MSRPRIFQSVSHTHSTGFRIKKSLITLFTKYKLFSRIITLSVLLGICSSSFAYPVACPNKINCTAGQNGTMVCKHDGFSAIYNRGWQLQEGSYNLKQTVILSGKKDTPIQHRLVCEYSAGGTTIMAVASPRGPYREDTPHMWNTTPLGTKCVAGIGSPCKVYYGPPSPTLQIGNAGGTPPAGYSYQKIIGICTGSLPEEPEAAFSLEPSSSTVEKGSFTDCYLHTKTILGWREFPSGNKQGNWTLYCTATTTHLSCNPVQLNTLLKKQA